MLGIIDSWREKRRQREAYNQPSGLSASLLADIGLSGDDLEDLRRGRRHNGRIKRWAGSRMIMRSIRRRQLSRWVNTLALVSAGAVLFTPKLDTWPSPELMVMLLTPQTLGVTSS